MESGNRGNRQSGFFLKRGSSGGTATLRVGITRIDALDRRLASEVEEATAVDKEVGLVLMCLRLQLLSSASELCLAVDEDPYGVDLSAVTDLITSYKMAISDAGDAIARVKQRVRVA